MDKLVATGNAFLDACLKEAQRLRVMQRSRLQAEEQIRNDGYENPVWWPIGWDPSRHRGLPYEDASFVLLIAPDMIEASRKRIQEWLSAAGGSHLAGRVAAEIAADLAAA